MISINKTFDANPAAENVPRFGPGELVHHRRYGYRGVVVSADAGCRADPQWYMSNKTQPDRNQAWYHVLVHAATHVTYVAQSNLEPDSDRSPVDHPFVKHFFESFADGFYVRNERPWPE